VTKSPRWLTRPKVCFRPTTPQKVPGSRTEPGGYTGAGHDNLHYTERGRIRELAGNASEWATHATGQFDIADEREPSAVAATLTRLGYEPVWKDWDPAILSN